MKKTLSMTLCAALLLVLAACGGGSSAPTAAPASPSPAAEVTDPTPAPAEATAAENTPAAGELHHVEMEIADYGVITLELDSAAAPATVENFLKLAGDGFYDGLTFHRVMAGFMMQGGDPEGTGYGGSDETIPGEFAQNGWDNPISHVRGVISMARSNDPDSASSQFFIVHQDSTFLDGQYAAFGRVTQGMEVVDAVCDAAQPIDDNGTIPAEEQPVITSVTVLD